MLRVKKTVFETILGARRHVAKRQTFRLVMARSLLSSVAVLLVLSALISSLSHAASGYWDSAPLTNSGVNSWSHIASSDNGHILAATTGNGSVGDIYLSTDAGASWIDVSAAGTREWSAIDMSGDGSTIVATATNDNIYISTDGGTSWAPEDSARNWTSLQVSDTGTMIASDGGGQVYASSDNGQSWQVQSLGMHSWTTVAISSDGSTMAAGFGGGFSGQFYITKDGGANWTFAGGGYRDWSNIALSADGSKVIALGGNDDQFAVYNTTTDDWDYSNHNGIWTGVSMSADGNKIVAVAADGAMTTSLDYGVTWNDQSAPGSSLSWEGVAMTSDGTSFVATANGDYIYGGNLDRSPNAPTNLSATSGNQQASLSWTTPSDNGGAAITDYKIEYSDNGGNDWIEFTHSASTATSETITGLTNGFQYLFRVSAINIAGQGDISSTATARPLATPVITTGTPQTITVTTTVDEDSAPGVGTGCSIREAAIAASLAVAYGGCAAGSGTGDTIYVPDGIYDYDSNTFPSADIQLYGASLVGQSELGTIVDSYHFIMTTNTAAHISTLTLNRVTSGTNVYITGSNKTVSHVTGDGSVPIDFLIGNGSSTISDTLFDTVTISSNVPTSSIRCTGSCDNTTVENSSLIPQYQEVLDVGTHATIENSTIESTYSTTVTVGANGTLTNNNVNATQGTSSVVLTTGAVVDGLTQNVTSGGTAQISGTAASLANITQNVPTGNESIQVDTPLMHDLTATSNSGAYIINNYVGSAIYNVTLNTIGTYWQSKASTLHDISLPADTTQNYVSDYFQNTANNATISAFDFDASSLSVQLNGDNATISNIHYVEDGGTNQLEIIGDSPHISQVTMQGGSLHLHATGNATIDAMTINNGQGLNYSQVENLTLQNSIFTNNSNDGVYLNLSNSGHVIMDNVVIDNNVDGLEMDGDGSVTSASLHNVSVTNTTWTFGDPMYFSDIDNVAIDGATITGNASPYNNSIGIFANDGTTESVKNADIENNGGDGIYVQAPNADVTIDNVKVTNPQSGGTTNRAIYVTSNNVSINKATVTGMLDEATYLDFSGTASIKNASYADNEAGIVVSPSSGGSSTPQFNADNLFISNTSSTSPYGSLELNNDGNSTISNLTITGNQTQGVPALSYHGGNHTLTNATITGNNGGGLVATSSAGSATLSVLNSTIARNNYDGSGTPSGAGVTAIGDGTDSTLSATVLLKNSLVFDNLGSAQCTTINTATITSTGTISSDGSCGSGATQNAAIGDSVATTLASNNSVRTLLGYNGTSGLLPTLALDSTSAAIGAGSALACTSNDARGLERDLASGCDVGAYQYRVVVPVVVTTSTSTGDVSTNSSSSATSRSHVSPSNGAKTDTATSAQDAIPNTAINTNGISKTASSDSDKTVDVVKSSRDFLIWIIIGALVLLAATITIVISVRNIRRV